MPSCNSFPLGFILENFESSIWRITARKNKRFDTAEWNSGDKVGRIFDYVIVITARFDPILERVIYSF